VAYENSDIPTGNSNQDEPLKNKIKQAWNMSSELHGTYAQDELLNLLAVTELAYVNEQNIK